MRQDVQTLHLRDLSPQTAVGLKALFHVSSTTIETVRHLRHQNCTIGGQEKMSESFEFSVADLPAGPIRGE